MRELDVQHQVVKLFEAIGATVYSTSQHRKPTHSAPQRGLPDLLILMPGGRGAVLFEVKSEQGKQSTEQYWCELACVKAAVPYLCGGMDAAQRYLAGEP